MSCYIDGCSACTSYVVHSYPDTVRLCAIHAGLHPVEPYETLCLGADTCPICKADDTPIIDALDLRVDSVDSMTAVEVCQSRDDLPHCMIVQDGEICFRPSVPGAPFPICTKHAAQVMEFLRTSMSTRSAPWRTSRAPTAGPVVYYLRLDGLIKIGTTSRPIKQRMLGYPPSTELIVTEPGGRDLESQRLKQFSHALRAGREWFEPTPDLLAHIADLERDVSGDPGRVA